MGEHDQLFKRAFRLPANAAGELASVLPADVLADLDLASLEALPGDYVDQRLRERFADALFRARFRGTPGYVFFLLEHQSTSDRWMPLRVLEEMARIWREILRHEPERTTHARVSENAGRKSVVLTTPYLLGYKCAAGLNLANAYSSSIRSPPVGIRSGSGSTN